MVSIEATFPSGTISVVKAKWTSPLVDYFEISELQKRRHLWFSRQNVLDQVSEKEAKKLIEIWKYKISA